MKRTGPEPEDFLTPILVRVMDARPEVKQRDLARALNCSPSRISHIRTGTQRLTGHELVVFCSVYETYEPLDAMADRLGLEVSDKPAPTSQPKTVRRATACLMRDVAALTLQLDDAEQDGVLDDSEVAEIDATLVAVIEGAKGARARLPRRQGA